MAGSKPESRAPGDAEAENAWREAKAALTSLEGDAALLREGNFPGRAEAFDRIESDILDRIEGLPGESGALRARAGRLTARLEAADAGLFRRLRADILRTGCRGPAFCALLEPFLGPDLRAGRGSAEGMDRVGYDHRDAFFNGLLHSRPLPDETRPREPGMVFYQKTPARVILALAEAARLSPADAFYDVGSGLGQVAILIHLLTGAATRGIEVEPAYCDYARACAEDLGLRGVEFLPVDARSADYSAGSVFFLYTPCEGRMLEEVLERMGTQARPGSRIFTFGPCTGAAARCRWLRQDGPPGQREKEFGAFVRERSVVPLA